MAEAYRRLGEAHFNLGQLDQALDSEKYFLALAHIASNDVSKLKAMNMIGRILTTKKDFNSALKVFAKSLRLAKACCNLHAEAAVYGLVGGVYAGLGRLDKALQFFSQELAICDRLDDTLGKYNALGRLGTHYAATGQATLALKTFEEQITVSQLLKDKKPEADALRAFAQVCAKFGMNERALKAQDQALSLLSLSGKADSLETLPAVTLLEKAGILEKIGRLVAAVRTYDQYLQSLNERTDAQLCANTANRVAALWLQLGNFEKALANFDYALELCADQETNVNGSVRLNAKRGKAAGLVGLRRFDDALQLCIAIANDAEQSGSVQHRVRAMVDLACADRLLGEQSLERLRAACSLADSINDPLMQCLTLSHLAEAHERAADLSSAINTYQQVGSPTSPNRTNSFSGPIAVLTTRCQLKTGPLNYCHFVLFSSTVRCLACCLLAAGDENGSLLQIESAIGAAATLNRPDLEFEGRIVKAVLHWSMIDYEVLFAMQFIVGLSLQLLKLGRGRQTKTLRRR